MWQRECAEKKGVVKKKHGRKEMWQPPPGCTATHPLEPPGDLRGQRGNYQFSTLETMTSPPYAREHFASLSEMGLGTKFNSYLFCLLIPSDAWTVSQVLLMLHRHAEIVSTALLRGMLLIPCNNPSRALVNLQT